MTSSFTTAKNLEKPAAGDYSGTWAPPLNANWDVVEKALAGTQSYSMASTDTNATQAELQNLRIKVTGTLTANVALKIPVGIPGHWIVSNGTTGAFSLTVKQATGDTGVAITQGKSTLIFSDGTNCIYGVDIVVPVTDLSPYMQKSQNLNDVADKPTSRTNLGLGNSATRDVGTGSGQVAAGDDTRFTRIPQNAQTGAYALVATDAGKHVSVTGNVTVNSGVFAIGDAVTIFNNSGSTLGVAQGTSVTMTLAGTSTTGNRALAVNGLCTILCVASNTFVISGAGLS